MTNKIKFKGYPKALVFFLTGSAICFIVIIIIAKNIFTGIIIVVPYLIGLISVVYGIHIAVDTYFKWLNEDYSEKIYIEIMAKK